MFKNYVTVALRNLWKNKAFSIINIIGLSIGISAALVIYLIVQYDFSFDKFEKDNDRIYRVVTNMKFAGNPFLMGGATSPLGVAVKNEMTGFDAVAKFQMFSGNGDVTIPQTTSKKADVFKSQGNIIFADGDYTNLLSYKWLAGSPQTALAAPNKVVLTEKQARKYFPNQEPSSMIGRQVIYDDTIKTFVSGIVADITQHSDFTFQQFISLQTIPSSTGLKASYSWDQWGANNSSSQLCLKLTEGNTVAKVEAGLKGLLKKYNKTTNIDDKNITELKLQPLGDIHFNNTYGAFYSPTASKPTLYGLLAAAVFLLLLGCINFINLTTAQSSQRAKEIGIRKTMGGTKQQLMLQFLTETFFITVIATLLAMAVAPILMNIFGNFIPAGLHFSLSKQPGIIAFLVGLIITVSLLSGFYPAFILSKFNPVLVLKNQAYQGTASTRRAWVRKGLTVFQFFIAQVFVMATIITAKQIHFMINTDLGFKKDAIIGFSTPYNQDPKTAGSKQLVLLNQLKAIPGIQMVALGDAPASMGWGATTMTYKDGRKEIETDVRQKDGDTNYIKLYHIKLLAGRGPLPQDSLGEYAINETYMHILGFKKPQDALHKLLSGHPIVGVMADFHEESMRKVIQPLVFSIRKQTDWGFGFSVALSPQTLQGTTWAATIQKMEAVYKKLYPDDSFGYIFLDENIAQFYKSEQDTSRLLKWATGLAVFISCIGLLGLVIFTTNQRRKEISIRKVLGATVTHIVSILSKDFTRLVIIAFVIATPVVWWLMHAWLENFAYRTTISWWVFLISGVLMVLLALLTLSIQTIKAATANPVKSLKEE